MASSFLAAAASRTNDAASSHAPVCTARDPHLVNCLMLCRWPQRREMVQQAVASFLCQDHPHKVLTIVNDGQPCRLTGAFIDAAGIAGGSVVQVPGDTTIGEKRNVGAAAVPHASYVASFDDDDFSLPSRLRAHLDAIGDAVWLSASRKFISITTLTNIVGFEVGRCYGAGMISTRVTDELRWPHLSWCEDHRLYETVKAHPIFGPLVVEDDTLAYVHRRHETNASAEHRQSLWQGVLPLQLAGPGAVTVKETVGALVAPPCGPFVEDDVPLTS